MFDDQNQNPNAPKNLPTEPVDMFAGVEKEEGAVPPSVPDALAVGLLKKKDEVTSNVIPARAGIQTTDKWIPNQVGNDSGTPMQNYKTSAPILGKILLFLLVVLLLGGLGYGGWWFFYASKNTAVKLPVAPANQTVQNQTPQNVVPANTNVPAQQNNDQILFGQAVDADKDGLDDVREKEIGTNPQNTDSDGDGLSDGDEVIVYKTDPLKADTDGDGLSDGDEVLIWHTNPLNQDSDGDTYLDGEEVRNGYNPLGAGKLFAAPATTTVSATNS